MKDPRTDLDEAPVSTDVPTVEDNGLVVVGLEVQETDGTTLAVCTSTKVRDDVAQWMGTDDYQKRVMDALRRSTAAKKPKDHRRRR